MKKYLDHLKQKWGIKSSFQLIMILVVFSITGSAVVFLKKYFFQLIGLTPDHPFWLRTIIYLVSIPPAYFVLLLMIGSALGQSRFFLGYARKMLKRIGVKK